jgi:hypothetical protein
MKSCLSCKWCRGTFRDNAGCDWLYKAHQSPLPPFLKLYDVTLENINITTDACFPKEVDPKTANECECYAKVT